MTMPGEPERTNWVTRISSPAPAADPLARAPSGNARPGPASLPEARELLAQGRVAEACALARNVAARRPDLAAPWKFLGQCYMRLADRTQAIAYYRRYLELSPDGPDAVFVREMIKQEQP